MALRDETTAFAGRAPGVPRQQAARPGPISLEPATAYEAVTRQMVLALQEDLREIKARLNGLLFMVAGSVLLEVVTRVMGDR